VIFDNHIDNFVAFIDRQIEFDLFYAWVSYKSCVFFQSVKRQVATIFDQVKKFIKSLIVWATECSEYGECCECIHWVNEQVILLWTKKEVEGRQTVGCWLNRSTDNAICNYYKQ